MCPGLKGDRVGQGRQGSAQAVAGMVSQRRVVEGKVLRDAETLGAWRQMGREEHGGVWGRQRRMCPGTGGPTAAASLWGLLRSCPAPPFCDSHLGDSASGLIQLALGPWLNRTSLCLSFLTCNMSLTIASPAEAYFFCGGGVISSYNGTDPIESGM